MKKNNTIATYLKKLINEGELKMYQEKIIKNIQHSLQEKFYSDLNFLKDDYKEIITELRRFTNSLNNIKYIVDNCKHLENRLSEIESLFIKTFREINKDTQTNKTNLTLCEGICLDCNCKIYKINNTEKFFCDKCKQVFNRDQIQLDSWI